MEINNQIISEIGVSDISGESFIIEESIVKKIYLGCPGFLETKLVMRKCVIYEIFLHTTWFKQGLIMEDCVIINEFNYENGGHNDEPVIIARNIFHEFAVFSDAQFHALVVIEDNLFLGGTNILNYHHTMENNRFAKERRIRNNIGELDGGL